jgi:pentatricopeptide repeat protein
VPLFTPDEGVRLLVLYTAALHGDVQLASSVLRALELEGLPRKEHHYAALVEAHARLGQFAKVFSTLSQMRKNGLSPSFSTISSAISECGSSEESVASALSELRVQHDTAVEAVDIESFHLVLSAFVCIGNLEGALNLYKNRPETFPNFDMQPNTDTFNILLSGCATTGHIDIATFITAEMKAIGIDPNEQTYEALVKTCLNAPYMSGERKPYQLALLYLEETGVRGFTLAQNVYMETAMKCAEEDDVQSAMEVFEEMESRGWDGSDARQKLYRKWRDAKPVL